MKLEEGMFIRYEGLINKIIEIDEDYIVFDMNWFDHWADEVSSMKYDRFVNDYKPVASHNLLGNDKEPCLIEPGDYVNGYIVDDIETIGNEKYVIITINEAEYLKENQIKSIVTKEQFENMSYKI